MVISRSYVELPGYIILSNETWNTSGYFGPSFEAIKLYNHAESRRKRSRFMALISGSWYMQRCETQV